MVAGQTIDNPVRDSVAVSDSPLVPGRTGALRDFFRGAGVRRSFESLEVNIRYMRAESGGGLRRHDGAIDERDAASAD